MRRALAGFLLLSWAALAAPVRFGPDVPVSVAEWDESPNFKHQPSIATDGTHYLAVWTSTGVTAARVAHDGAVLDPVNLHIGMGSSPAVVWTGRVYVIAWAATDSTVWATVVTRDGEIVRSRRISHDHTAILRATTNGKTIAIAARGQDAVVLLIDENLELIARQVVKPHLRPVHGLDVAALGDDYLVAAVAEGERWSAFTFPLAANGNLGAPVQVPDSLDVRGVAIAGNGRSYLLAFDRLEDVNTLVLSPQNEPVGSVRTVVPVRAKTNAANYLVNVLTTIWRGDEYLVNYIFDNESYQQKLLRVSADGAAIGSPSNTFARSQAGVAITARPDGSGAALWFGGNRFFAGGDVSSHVSFFDGVSLAAGAPFFDDVAPARSAHAQTMPALEPIDGLLAAAWLELLQAKREIRLTYGGRMVVVADAEGLGLGFLDVVWDGEAVNVLWQYEGQPELYVRRYTRALAATDDEPQVVLAHDDAVRVDGAAGGGGEVLVTWRTVDNKRIAHVIGKAGVIIGPNGYYFGAAKPMWDGMQFVVFMPETAAPLRHPNDPSPYEASIVAIRVSAQGAISGPVTVYHVPGATVFGVEVSGNVIAWQEMNGVRVARFDGNVLTGVRKLDWAWDNLEERLKVAALRDGGADIHWIDGTRVEHDRLTPDLEPTGKTSFTIARNAFDATATGKVAHIAYTRVSPEDGYVVRVFVRSSEAAFKRRAVR